MSPTRIRVGSTAFASAIEGGHGTCFALAQPVAAEDPGWNECYGPSQRAVPIAKYLFTNGGAFRLAYQMRKLPSANRTTDWLVV